MPSGTIILTHLLIQRKKVQINVRGIYHSVVNSRLVSLANEVPHCLDNILHKPIHFKSRKPNCQTSEHYKSKVDMHS